MMKLALSYDLVEEKVSRGGGDNLPDLGVWRSELFGY
jgi:hypothetical protein